MTTEGSTVAATQTSMTNNDNQMTTLGPVTPEQEAVKSQVSVIFLTTFLCILVHGSAIYRVSQYKVSESKSYIGYTIWVFMICDGTTSCPKEMGNYEKSEEIAIK